VLAEKDGREEYGELGMAWEPWRWPKNDSRSFKEVQPRLKLWATQDKLVESSHLCRNGQEARDQARYSRDVLERVELDEANLDCDLWKAIDDHCDLDQRGEK
jgi:hypothetical protein